MYKNIQRSVKLNYYQTSVLIWVASQLISEFINKNSVLIWVAREFINKSIVHTSFIFLKEYIIQSMFPILITTLILKLDLTYYARTKYYFFNSALFFLEVLSLCAMNIYFTQIITSLNCAFADEVVVVILALYIMELSYSKIKK